MGDRIRPNSKWRKFLNEEELLELMSLEDALDMYDSCAKETRAAIRVLRDKHSWKLRRTNPYGGDNNGK